MSELRVDRKSIKQLFTDKTANFLIPDYQRPYAWGEDECQTLWDDVFEFAFPNNDKDKFQKEQEYFLGAIVMYKNKEKDCSEIIDGQQRLTTILLLLRAFYDRFEHMADKPSLDMRNTISQCIWQTDEFGNADMQHLKIDSEVATDDEKEEFLSILRNGNANITTKNKYANNYLFFVDCIEDFIQKFASFLPYLPARILNNCIMLPIEADSQDTALKIFSTLNDRGLPLADADIFKAQFYKYYEKLGSKDDFIANWKELATGSDKIFKPLFGTPMDELFTKYMYYLRAKEGIKVSTTEALRKFYEHEKYRRLLQADTIENLLNLLDFWSTIHNKDTEKFSRDTLKKLFVLKYAPNGMWEYITSVYFMSYRNGDNELDDAKFGAFLSRITAFIFAYALTNPGVNALRTPIYAQMLKIINKQECDFSGHLFTREQIEGALKNYQFTNVRTVTRSLLTWYAFTFDEQECPSAETKFDIEHIYAKERYNKDKGLVKPDNLEALGNKILLEKSINIRASDFRFADKKRYYLGYTDARNNVHEKSMIAEYAYLTQKSDFTESDLIERDELIKEKFIEFLAAEKLLV